jgi:Fic family protein
MYIHKLSDWPRLDWFNADDALDPVLKAGLAHCSQDTALRDILGLVEHGVLIRNPQGGRSTSYALSAIIEDERRP